MSIWPPSGAPDPPRSSRQKDPRTAVSTRLEYPIASSWQWPRPNAGSTAPYDMTNVPRLSGTMRRFFPWDHGPMKLRRWPFGLNTSSQRAQQIRLGHRLDQVGIEASLRGAPPILFLPPSGHGDQRHGLAPGLPADAAGNLEPVQARHAEIEQQHVGRERRS